MDALQGHYKQHLQENCRNTVGNTEACAADEDSWRVMCVNAHAAELVIDQIAVLGVGCPLPKPKYAPPPPKPCWFEGEHNCPDPELERCDIIAREMEKISGMAKL